MLNYTALVKLAIKGSVGESIVNLAKNVTSSGENSSVSAFATPAVTIDTKLDVDFDVDGNVTCEQALPFCAAVSQ